MEYQKLMKCICFLTLTLSTLGIYFLFTDQYTLLLQTFIQTNKLINTTLENDSILILNNEIETNLTFESRLSDYYPRLPIHIYTQNLSLLTNRTKLILVGNGFFGDRNWGFIKPNRSSTEIMTTLHCPFLSNYCDITTDYKDFSRADAIVYHMRDGFDKIFAQKNRQSHQRFVFALWESPAHTSNLESYRQFFNWTMTYRFQSHILTSYYSGNAFVHKLNPYYQLMLNENRTKHLNLKLSKHVFRPSDEVLNRKKLGLAAALISNCGGSSRRLDFINQLKRYIDIKIYGRCGENCPPNRSCRDFIAENYYFILSFENSLCTDYTTEKFFASLEHPVVPVVLGQTNYSYFLPSSAFIDVNQFSTMKSLGEYLNKTRYDKEKYLSYFSWKRDYVWGLSHFFTPFCDLCVRLHLDTKPNIMDDMQKWWFDNTCQSPNILR